MRTSAFSVVAAFAIVTGSTAVNAATTTYTDAMAFMAAQTGMVLVEDFEDAMLIPGLSIMSDNGFIDGGLFNDLVEPGGAQTMFMKNGMTSFGGTFDLDPGGFGSGLAFSITLNDDSIVSVGAFEAYNGFFGFTSTDIFKKVTITGIVGGTCCVETYSLDNLKVGMVPEPGTWAMLISGFGLVGAVARRRRAVVAA